MKAVTKFAGKTLFLAALVGFIGFGFTTVNEPSTKTGYFLECQWWCPSTGFGSSPWPCYTQGCYDDAALACQGERAIISC